MKAMKLSKKTGGNLNSAKKMKTATEKLIEAVSKHGITTEGEICLKKMWAFTTAMIILL